MTIASLRHLNLFKIYDESSQKTYYGCDQKWYPKKWQRLSGCGPSAATNIYYYLSHTQPIRESEKSSSTKKNWISLMEEMWRYVTPSIRGVHTTQMFYQPMLNFTRMKGLNLEHYVCEVPEEQFQRPCFQDILHFIKGGLSKDAPVAFLNLNNGAVQNLERWHWVTIISLEYIENGSYAFVDILDSGLIKKIDLALWYATTTLGGGFVYFKEKY